MRAGIVLVSAAGVFLAAWALAWLHPFGGVRNAPTEASWTLLKYARMSEQAKAILRNKCADCHSEATRWPIYSRMAPVSWLIERDVAEGRRHMDFSQWQSYSGDRQDTLVRQIAHEAREKEMPPLQYRLVHWGAALSPADQAVLTALATGEPAYGATAETGDAARGQSVFARKCTGCHAIDVDREGPHLRGVYGRTAGTAPGFRYSRQLKSSGLVWKEDTLERWLEDTDAFVPGSAMGFSVPKAQDRADIVAFLKSLH